MNSSASVSYTHLYQQERDAKEAVAFLKHEYGYYRHSHTFVDGGQGFVEYPSDKGMILRRYEPEQAIKLTWNAIDKRLRELVTARRYLTTEELASLITQADIDALLVQDWNCLLYTSGAWPPASRPASGRG